MCTDDTFMTPLWGGGSRRVNVCVLPTPPPPLLVVGGGGK